MNEDKIKLYDMLFIEFSKHCNKTKTVKHPLKYILFVEEYLFNVKKEVNQLGETYDKNGQQ